MDRLVSTDDLIKRLHWVNSLDAELLAGEVQKLKSEPHAQDLMAQTQLFQQATDVLHSLSEVTPIVLVLDDLQWADRSSLGLLFHLARRIQNKRILIICAYRLEEIPNSIEDDALSWSHLVHEIRRLYGNHSIDLEKLDDEENRQFIDALLHTQFDQATDAFKQELFQYTQGHPLFTIELLLSLQSKNQLNFNEDGLLTGSEGMVWEQLPERIEAIIELRLQGLPETVQEILAVAAVEGQTFTAQVIAKVIGLSERRTVSLLSQSLVQQFHILTNGGQQQRVGGVVDIFRFNHALFHTYLIQHLSASEKRLLHGEVAEVLESLYKDELNTAVLTIANHYEKAGSS